MPPLEPVEIKPITDAADKRTDRFFKISVFAKGLASVLEMMAGVAVLILPFTDIARQLVYLAEGELLRDPDDFIATNIIHFAHQFSVKAAVTLALYLLIRGIIKFGLVIALLKRYLWAYPLSMGVLGLAMAYQTYLIVTTHSAIQIGLTILDIIVLWFIWKEYKILKERMLLKAGKNR